MTSLINDASVIGYYSFQNRNDLNSETQESFSSLIRMINKTLVVAFKPNMNTGNVQNIIEFNNGLDNNNSLYVSINKDNGKMSMTCSNNNVKNVAEATIDLTSNNIFLFTMYFSNLRVNGNLYEFNTSNNKVTKLETTNFTLLLNNLDLTKLTNFNIGKTIDTNLNNFNGSVYKLALYNGNLINVFDCDLLQLLMNSSPSNVYNGTIYSFNGLLPYFGGVDINLSNETKNTIRYVDFNGVNYGTITNLTIPGETANELEDTSIAKNHLKRTGGRITYVAGRDAFYTVKTASGANNSSINQSNVNEVTFSSWVYLNNSITNGMPVCVANQSRTGLFIDGNQLRYSWNNTGRDYLLGPSIPTQKWTHVALTIDSTSVKFYLNGVLTHVRKIANPSLVKFGDLNIGYDYVTKRSLSGALQGVAVFKRALERNEVVALYSLSSPDCVSDLTILEQTRDSTTVSYKAPKNANHNMPIYVIKSNPRKVNMATYTPVPYLSGLVENNMYAISVQVYTPFGKSQLSTITTLVTTSSKKSSAPENVRVIVSDKQNKITWSNPILSGHNNDGGIASVMSYNVYDENNNLLQNTTQNYIIHDNLNNNTEYSYYVTALNSADLESEASELVVGTPFEAEIPSEPSVLEAYGSDGSILIKWSECESNRAKIDEYIVILEKESQIVGMINLNPTVLETTIENLINEVEYKVSVSAKNRVGNGPSKSIKVVPRSFNIRNMNNLLAWFDAADYNTINVTSENAVTQWNSKVGSLVALPTSNTKFESPLLLSEQLNGFSTVSMSNNNYFVVKNDFDVSNLTFVGLVYIDAPNDGVIMSTGIVNDNERGVKLNKESVELVSGNNKTVSQGVLVEGNWYVIAVTFNNKSSVNLSLNGKNYNFTMSLNKTETNGFKFGLYNSNNENVEMQIAELMVFSSALSDVNRQQLEGYLACKWDLQDNLENNHPYSIVKPYISLASAPTEPSNLVGELNNGQTRLSWSKSVSYGTNVEGESLEKVNYLVYDLDRDNLITSTTNTIFNVKSSLSCNYCIKAVNILDLVSESSNVLNFNPKSSGSRNLQVLAGSAPSEPQNVTVEAISNSSVHISWRQPKETGTSDGMTKANINQYSVYNSLNPDLPEVVVDGNTTSCIINDLNRNTLYTYFVVATNDAGMNSSVSKTVGVKTLDLSYPGAPSNLRNTNDDEKVHLEWDEPSNKGNSEILGYRIEMYNGNDWTVIESNCMDTKYTINNLTNGNGYMLRVVAVNILGVGEYSNVVNACPLSLPKEISEIKVKPYENYVELSWEEPLRTGNIESYKIEKSLDGIKWELEGNTTNKEFVSSNLKPGALYYYRIFTKNPLGYAQSSPIVSAITISVPHPPTIKYIQSGNNSFIINYDQSDNILPAITKYRLTLDGGLTYKYKENDMTSSWFVTEMNNNISNKVQISALNENGWSQLSNLVETIPSENRSSIYRNKLSKLTKYDVKDFVTSLISDMNNLSENEVRQLIFNVSQDITDNQNIKTALLLISMNFNKSNILVESFVNEQLIRLGEASNFGFSINVQALVNQILDTNKLSSWNPTNLTVVIPDNSSIKVNLNQTNILLSLVPNKNYTLKASYNNVDSLNTFVINYKKTDTIRELLVNNTNISLGDNVVFTFENGIRRNFVVGVGGLPGGFTQSIKPVVGGTLDITTINNKNFELEHQEQSYVLFDNQKHDERLIVTAQTWFLPEYVIQTSAYVTNIMSTKAYIKYINFQYMGENLTIDMETLNPVEYTNMDEVKAYALMDTQEIPNNISLSKIYSDSLVFSNYFKALKIKMYNIQFTGESRVVKLGKDYEFKISRDTGCADHRNGILIERANCVQAIGALVDDKFNLPCETFVSRVENCYVLFENNENDNKFKVTVKSWYLPESVKESSYFRNEIMNNKEFNRYVNFHYNGTDLTIDLESLNVVKYTNMVDVINHTLPNTNIIPTNVTLSNVITDKFVFGSLYKAFKIKLYNIEFNGKSRMIKFGDNIVKVSADNQCSDYRNEIKLNGVVISNNLNEKINELV